MSVQNKSKDTCCGCTACEAICNHKAIIMKPDALGFFYPEVDEEKCTDCGLCEKVCAFHANYITPFNFAQPEIYAAKHRDPAEVAASQSGAAFVAISDWILDQGGVVYGVGYGEHFVAIHKRATNKAERDEFRGSKYVQSDVNTCFAQIKQDLKDGNIVLFTGTPCQVAGLSSYIPKQLKEKLYTMDIVCHGVPSPRMWQDYLYYLERKEGKKITSVNFRDKTRFGWKSHVESFCFENTYTYTYTYTFYSHINLRASCAICPFTNLRRPSDITVADFWGIEKTEAAKLGADNRGCSMFLLNTPKGGELFDAIRSNLIAQSVTLRKEWFQPQMQHPTIFHPQSKSFANDYAEIGMEKTLRKYGLLGWKPMVKRYLRPLVPILRKFFKIH